MSITVIRGLHNFPQQLRGCVASIGNFDGVHLGHQAVLARLIEKSRALRLPVAIVVFEPQPQEFFAGNQLVPPRLTRLREKIKFLADYGADIIVCLPFNKKLSLMPAPDFLKTGLIDNMGLRHLVVGEDFRFGYKREGDFALLSRFGKLYNFGVEKAVTVSVEGERVSSTRIRHYLVQGKLAEAAKLLKRPFSMEGRVAHGDKRGRVIGFPTANIFLHRQTSPIRGVYAVKCYGVTECVVYGVANVGARPTVGGTHNLLEVHLFDFAHNIYGRHIQVEFCKKIRDEKKFDSFELLKEQIARDAAIAGAYFKNTVITG